MSELSGFEFLLNDEAQPLPGDVLVVDAPQLAAHLSGKTRVRAWADEWTAHHSIPADIRVEPFTESPVGPNSVALAKAPKALAELDEIASFSANNGYSRLLVAERIRHLNRSMNSVLERHFDAVSASLGLKKARALRGVGPRPSEHPWPKSKCHDGLWLAAHGGTFAGTKIDPGTRLLIDHLDQVEGADVIDFGCGNGVLATLLARSERRVKATDSSWAAVAATWRTAQLNEVDIDLSWASGLSEMGDASADAIVTNPPFHQGHAKDSQPTIDMFADAKRVLRPGGEFWCVFNSHLPWRSMLNETLGRTLTVARTPSYTLTKTIR